MRATRLLAALPLVLTLAFAGCQSDGPTGLASDEIPAASGPLSVAEGECDPNLLPC